MYPNAYSVGMASLAFQTVFRIFNSHPEVRCERAFADPRMRTENIWTIESGSAINNFDMIAFAISFEGDIVNVIKSLLLSGIPPFNIDRGNRDPLVITGGVMPGINPSPLLSFMDGLLIGEGEGFFMPFLDLLIESKRNNKKRDLLLEDMAMIQGFLVPGINKNVTRRIANLKTCSPAHTHIITPFSHFENMFVVETGRGCSRGCLFCAAQNIYRPSRIFKKIKILETIEKCNPGASRIGLESAGLSDHPDLIEICEHLIEKDLQVSFSSIRADKVTAQLVNLLKKTNIKSFTIAPETGCQVLRQKIKKQIDDDQIIKAAELLGQSAIEILKLYFLICFPEEKTEDIEAIGIIIKKIHQAFILKGKGRRIRVSVNSLIPKPFTPMQWAPMAKTDEINLKRKMIYSSIKDLRGVEMTQKNARQEILQSYLALGDSRMGDALYDSLIQNQSLRQCARQRNIDLNWFHMEKDINQIFPWEIINYYEKKENLLKYYTDFTTK